MAANNGGAGGRGGGLGVNDRVEALHCCYGDLKKIIDTMTELNQQYYDMCTCECSLIPRILQFSMVKKVGLAWG